MRDIRGDLQDRVKHLENEISKAKLHFEKTVEQLTQERDARVAELNEELKTVNRLIEAEHRRMERANEPLPGMPVAKQGNAQHGGNGISSANQHALVDLVLRKLTETGPMNMEELRNWSLQEGLFGDPDSAARGMHAILMAVAKGGRIRQLPNGTFAPALLMDQIRHRQAM